MSWRPSRLRERDTPMWAAYGLGLILAIQPSDSSGIRLATIAGLLVMFLLTTRYRLGWWGIAGLVVAGITLRLGVDQHRASDVMDVTSEALRQAALGLNPYGHGYLISRPPGAPFPYGPIAILWYMPALGDPRQLELFVACALILLFAVRGRPVGLAAYAMAPTVILTSVDGSNDTSAGVLILIALVVAAKRPALGAALLALAVGFKPYSLAWVPALFAYGGLSSLVGFGMMSVAIWVPTFWLWGLDAYLVSLHGADLTHRAPYWSFGVIYEAFTQRAASHEALDQLRLALAGVATVVGLFLAKSIDRVIVIGTVVFAIMMFGGYWGSYAYIGAIAPILCWRLDDWIRVPAPDFIADKAWAPQPSPAAGATDATEEPDALQVPAPVGAPAAPPLAEPASHDPTEPALPVDGPQPAAPPAPAFSTRNAAPS